jgi:hypothetical protein
VVLGELTIAQDQSMHSVGLELVRGKALMLVPVESSPETVEPSPETDSKGKKTK